MYREGAHSAKQMCVSLHPAIIGLPSRIDYLDDVLGYMMSHEGVWQTTADDMADYYMENHYDTMVDFLAKHDYSA